MLEKEEHPNDLVKPFVKCIFTDYWFGARPDRSQIEGDLLAHLIENQFELEFPSCGLKMCVAQNGFVLFDFFRFNRAPVYVHRESLRSYQWHESGGASIVATPEVESKLGAGYLEQRLQENIRQQVVEVFLLLLASASKVPLKDVPKYYITDQYELTFPYPPTDRKQLGSTVVSWEKLEEVLQQFSGILESNILDLLIVIHLVSMSNLYINEAKYNESLTFSWLVCEWVVNYHWDDYIEAKKRAHPDKFPRKRLDRLRSPDFSIAVKSEMLSLAGELDEDLFGRLNTHRKRRNEWMHRLVSIGEAEAMEGHRLCEDLLNSMSDLELRSIIYPPALGGGIGPGFFRQKFEELNPDRKLP